MEKMGNALVLIVLGLIVLAFPLLGLIPLSLITGFAVLFLGVGLLLSGIAEMGESASLGILEIIFGVIALILGIGFIFNPGLFSWLVGFYNMDNRIIPNYSRYYGHNHQSWR